VVGGSSKDGRGLLHDEGPEGRSGARQGREGVRERHRELATYPVLGRLCACWPCHVVRVGVCVKDGERKGGRVSACRSASSIPCGGGLLLRPLLSPSFLPNALTLHLSCTPFSPACHF
jgi:hypothetical protein